MEGRCRTEGYEEGYYEGTGLVGGIAERVCLKGGVYVLWYN